MFFMGTIFKKLSNLLIKYLNSYVRPINRHSTHTFEKLKNSLRPGDVLLVEGTQRFSRGIKYLTQSNWSHSALYLGEEKIFEADIEEGVRIVDLELYRDYHTRICRPCHLRDEDLQTIIDFCKSRVGYTYDLKNIFDLARYLLPAPPVPNRWKRKLLEFGSGDPTKVICSSIIANAYQKVHYPILPEVKKNKKGFFFKKRHPTLFTPSDFDRSPYFQIIKPTLEAGFDYKNFTWGSEGP